jgi:chaperonin GroES
MRKGKKELLVVGDRVLIQQDESASKTKVGLLLPPGVSEKEDVWGGFVVAVGPGQALPPPQVDDEPWRPSGGAPRYLPMEVNVGDFALFYRKAAIEISFEDEKYLVVPHGALLVLVRDTDVPSGL